MNNTIFSKGREKILECFYRNKGKELYFSEILRGAKLTPNNTLEHLKTLMENNLLISTKKTGNTFYRLNIRNSQLISLLSYFDYKKLESLPPARKRAIIDFLDKIDNKPVIALVFGSTAKGTFNEQSDIDLLLVFNKKENDNPKLKKDIEAITGTKIQTFIIDLDYFKEQALKHDDKVVSHAIKTGFVIMGHYTFYNEVLK